MPYNCKNPVWAGEAAINLEWEHPTLGWIPFTASPGDSEEHGRQIYAAAAAGEYGPIQDASPAEPAPPAYPRFTALEMLDLFSQAEQLAVVQATMSVPEVKLWYDRLIAAMFVTYEDPRTDEGLQALVDAGLLTLTRKAEIVAAMQPPASV